MKKKNEMHGTPLVSENVPNKPQNVPWKKNKAPWTPLVSESVPNKPQNVPWKKKYLGHHLLVKMSLINHITIKNKLLTPSSDENVHSNLNVLDQISKGHFRWKRSRESEHFFKKTLQGDNTTLRWKCCQNLFITGRVPSTMIYVLRRGSLL